MWVVVVLFGLVTYVRSRQVDLPMRDPRGAIFTARVTLSGVLLIVFAILDAIVRTGRRGWTPRRAVAMLRSRWPLHRVVLVVSGLLAYHVVYACYRNVKSWVAFRDMKDQELLDFERWAFGGSSPAVLLHDMFGESIAPHVFQVIYESFSTLVPISFVAALVFANKIREGYVFLTSAMWAWILGVAAYYMIPSLGPFASAPEEFAGLARTSITATQEKYLAQREQLLSQPQLHDSFASIGAFASLHTGFTFLILLMLRYYGFHRAVKVMVVYLIAVMVSTIYLGWHFVVDDIAGLLLALAAFHLGRLTTYPRGKPST